jgi:hypothetical protein
MSWVDWIDTATKVYSAVSAKNASDQANRGFEENSNTQLGLENRRQQLAEKQYAEQEARFGPLWDKAISEAKSTEPLDYAENAAQINKGYGKAARDINELNYGTGMVNSGLTGARRQGYALKRQQDLASAYQTGITNRRNLAASLLGRDQTMAAGQGVQNAMQGGANTYGAYASMYGNAAKDASQAYGSNLGQLIGSGIQYARTNWPSQTKTKTNPYGGGSDVPPSELEDYNG